MYTIIIRGENASEESLCDAISALYILTENPDHNFREYSHGTIYYNAVAAFNSYAECLRVFYQLCTAYSELYIKAYLEIA